MNMMSVMEGVVFSIIGLAMFRHGKREAEWLPLLCGVLLMLVPLIIGNPWGLFVTGVGLTIAPWWAEIGFAVSHWWATHIARD